MEVRMPRGAYTAKQDRKAEHIAEGYEKRGVSKKEAEERAWRTVNKQDQGGKNDGSGRSKSRSAAAKKGWETRRKRAKG
jgi:plasmid stabilization system protein ParE